MPDPDDFIPERVFPPVTRTAFSLRLSHAIVDGLASLLLNGAVVAWLASIGWPIQATSPTPEAISVELVDRIPGEQGPEEAKPGTTAQAGNAGGVRSPPTPPPAEADPVAPAAEALSRQKPDQQPEPQKETPPLTAATPAPLDHPSQDPTPRIVAAPPDPHEASPTRAEPDPNQSQAPAPAEPPKPVPAPQPPEQPKILAAGEAPDEAPPPSDAAETRKPEPTVEEKRQAENTAKLAAALPFSQSLMSDPFRASIAGSGSVPADQYRGAVYAAFRKADSILAEAQSKHLRGQAVIAFRIDDSGALVQAGVAISSGNAEIDRLALAIIQHSTPYPRPPLGAQHVFSPAIRFGPDQ